MESFFIYVNILFAIMPIGKDSPAPAANNNPKKGITTQVENVSNRVKSLATLVENQVKTIDELQERLNLAEQKIQGFETQLKELIEYLES